MAKYFQDFKTTEQTVQERAKNILHGPIAAIHAAGEQVNALAAERGGLNPTIDPDTQEVVTAGLLAELGDEAAPLAQLYTELTALADKWSDVPAPELQ